MAVEARGLSHSYPAGRRTSAAPRQPARALSDVSFRVPPGGLYGFLGPNGSGKTTLFRLLATVLPPARHQPKEETGEATVAGHDLWREPLAVRRALGVAFQSPALDRRLTVEENLRHGGHLYGLSGADLERRIDEGLERFSVADRRRDRVEVLSGGLRRRVELAKALLHRPRVLLLDEPSTGLDPRARRHLRELLVELAAGGVAVLLTTHFIEEAEACDRLILLHQGRKVAEGSAAELKRAVGSEVVTLTSHETGALAADLETACGALDLAGRVERSGPREVRLELGTHQPTDQGSDHDSHGTDRRGSATLAALARLAGEVAGWDERVSAVRVSRPTLEDVFLHHTGEALGAAEDAETSAATSAGEAG